MIIENIAQTKSDLKVEIKKNLKWSVIYNILVLCVMFLGSVLFFYVEECYYLTQPVKVYSQRCKEVCQDVMQLKNNTLQIPYRNEQRLNHTEVNETALQSPKEPTQHNSTLDQIIEWSEINIPNAGPHQ